MSKWISVSDKFPENERFVLTYSEDSSPSIRICFYSDTTERWMKNTGGKISHWMELPEFPKESE